MLFGTKHWVELTRLIVIPVILFLSLLILALSADMITTTNKYYNLYWTFNAFAVAVCVLTFSLGPMFAIDFLRRGAITSWIIVELSWGGFLWVLWLASAALSSENLQDAGGLCTNYRFAPNWWSRSCSEIQAIVAFSWLIWISWSFYLISLLTLSIISHTKGAPIWKTSVRDATFTPVNVDLSGAMGSPATEHKSPIHTPMQQQPSLQSYPPQQTYPNQAPPV